MIEIGSILILIIACILVIGFLDYRPARPTRPGTGPVPESGDTSIRSFSWDKSGISKSYHLQTEIQIRNDSYQSARSEFFDTTPSKIHMCSESEYFYMGQQEILHPDFGAFNYEISQVAEYLKDVADTELLSDIEFAGVILSFTQEQCIPYSYDKDSTGNNEYMRLPLETIYDTTGDCDCKAILACSLFKTLGFRVAFALMPGHAALAITLQNDDLPFANFVMNGKRWFYCETTGDYWNPGVLPDSINPNLVELKEV